MGLKCELVIKKMEAYVPYTKVEKYRDNTDRMGIVFDVEGLFQSLPQFYFNLLEAFKKHPITIGRVDDVHMSGNYQDT